MIRYIATYDGRLTGRTEEATPVCGQDFCDTCGDCLVCDYDCSCSGEEGKPHFWVRYLEKDEK